MTTLTDKKCIPCEGGVPPLTPEQYEPLLKQVDGWEIVNFNLSAGGKLEKQFKFKDFKQAMIFTNEVAILSENEGHHPVIEINYNKVKISLWTHAIGGLSENDFILAAKINTIEEK